MAKVKIFVELSGDDVAVIPDWVENAQDLDKFVQEFVKDNITVNYKMISDSMSREVFVETVTNIYQNALIRGEEDIEIIVADDIGKTYRIQETNEGFRCDEVGCCSDDIEDMSHAVYEHATGQIINVWK